MNTLILATAMLLQTPVAETRGPVGDTASVPARPAVDERYRAPAFPVAPDKVQHFMMSYAIASFAYGAGRAAGVEREPALAGAMAGTLVAGALKELIDARTGGDPSFGDFLADILGAAAAYAMLSQVR